MDTGDRDRLLGAASSLRGEVETLKVGLEAFTAMGPEIVEDLAGMGFRVFADLKLHDIPNTVRGAVGALVRLEVHMLTVHVSGGREMLEAAVASCREEAASAGVSPPLVLGVTVLTSLDDTAMREMGWATGAGGAVVSLAGLGMECGLDGLVASAREASGLRKELGPEPVIVTPGIRPVGADAQDQARTATPEDALRAGADYLVVGRAVMDEPEPLEALRAIKRSLGLS